MTHDISIDPELQTSTPQLQIQSQVDKKENQH